jgi:hypothetical protein
MMSEIVERLRTTTATAIQRLINGAFRRDGEVLEPDRRPRFSIPARPDEDDDLTVTRDLAEAADRITALEAECERLKEVKQLAAQYLERAAHVGGCGDGNCVILRPTGMHTNGGCRCLHYPDKNQRMGIMVMLMTAQKLARAALTTTQEKQG